MRTSARQLVLVLALAGGFTACGGGDDGGDGSATGAGADMQRVAGGEAGPSGPQAAPGYEELVDDQSARPEERFTPCSLVTRSEARAIVGAPIVTPLEAPQGPTCIYRTRTNDVFVTLAVQDVDLARVRREQRGIRRLSVAAHPAFCGGDGTTTLYSPVAGGRVLSIAAPCPVARQFARRALSRLAS